MKVLSILFVKKNYLITKIYVVNHSFLFFKDTNINHYFFKVTIIINIFIRYFILN